MIDLAKENPITLNAARDLPELQRDSKRPDLATLYRWSSKRGVRGVRLECVQIAGSRCTTVEAVRRFISALTEREIGTPAATVEQVGDAARAERELAREWDAKPQRRRATSAA